MKKGTPAGAFFFKPLKDIKPEWTTFYIKVNLTQKWPGEKSQNEMEPTFQGNEAKILL